MLDKIAEMLCAIAMLLVGLTSLGIVLGSIGCVAYATWTMYGWWCIVGFLLCLLSMSVIWVVGLLSAGFNF